MLSEPTSYIYVDLSYEKDYFQLGLFDNPYISLNIIHSKIILFEFLFHLHSFHLRILKH